MIFRKGQRIYLNALCDLKNKFFKINRKGKFKRKPLFSQFYSLFQTCISILLALSTYRHASEVFHILLRKSKITIFGIDMQMKMKRKLLDIVFHFHITPPR